MGFKKEADGTYSAVVSAYDHHKHNTKWFDGLKKSYTEKVTVKEAKRMGLKPYKVSQVGGKKVIQYLAN